MANKEIKSGTSEGMKESFKKATVEMLLLDIVQEESMYVYQIMMEMTKRSEGLYTVSTLYPAIYRLTKFNYMKEDGIKISEGNRARRFYSITPAGKEYYKQLRKEYDLITQGIHKIIDYKE